jgi:hypothetical protein
MERASGVRGYTSAEEARAKARDDALRNALAGSDLAGSDNHYFVRGLPRVRKPSVVDAFEIDASSVKRREVSDGGRCCCFRPCFKKYNTRACSPCGCICISILIKTIAVVLAFWIGGANEMRRVNEAPSTDHFYETAEVCASAPDTFHDPHVQWITYESAAEARADGKLVMHCGACGKCSNYNDVQIYRDTNGEHGDNLTDIVKACALQYFLPWGGRDAVNECLDKDVGFTPSCRDVWTDNVVCDAKKCVFTCTRVLITGKSNNDADEHNSESDGAAGGEALNDCLLCDEKICGPAFTIGAGANRRRAGISSAIGRDDENQLCVETDVIWTPDETFLP